MHTALADLFEPWGFYETETDEGFYALCYDANEEGDYVLITDIDGSLPQDAEQEIIFAYYRSDNSFEWSVSFESSRELLALIDSHSTTGSLVEIVKEHRDHGGYY